MSETDTDVMKMLPPAGTRKHLFYRMEHPEYEDLWVDLTILRKSKMFDSVPLYKFENGELLFALHLSGKMLRKLNIY